MDLSFFKINLINEQFILGIILATIYFLLLWIEQKYPLRKPTKSLLLRMVVNFTFTICVYVAALLIVSPIAKFTLQLTQNHQFGLLPFLHLTSVMHFIFGFLLMDLTFYYWHRMNHEIPLLWRFHNVHHCDPDLDVTTSMRFHFVEIAYSGLFRIVQLSLIGVNLWTFLCYEFCFQANTFFHHSNIKLPIKIERLINKIWVTPRMHGIHHSNFSDETNRNYGVLFSFWDRLHQTLRLNIPQDKITIGIPAYSTPSDNKIFNLLLMPFKRQRRYWQISNKNHLIRPSIKNNDAINFLAK